MKINLIGITLERDEVELSPDNMLTSWHLFHLGDQYLVRGNLAADTQLVFLCIFSPLVKVVSFIQSVQHSCDVIDGARALWAQYFLGYNIQHLQT